ncbi:MAG: clostripain [Selenomonadaceae bacterium]|nr:clostripain [Selenomonadaceae bacterium]
MNPQKFLKIFCTFVFAVCAFFISGCDLDDEDDVKEKVTFADAYDPNDTWLVYWYICGSDLESDGGAASEDIQEMLNANLPDNVKVLIQAGGANQWHNAVVKSGKTNLLLYDKDGLHELETQPDANMGAAETLAGFLQYGKDNFQADHKVFIFWDHGGGSAFGLCFDERTDDSLSLNEVHDAFASVYNNSPENPPFEVIGFDTCLMATYELANDLYGFAKYMVASEEVEPGNGWEYTGMLTALAENPAMGGDGLGQSICDTYYQGCEDAWTEDSVTLSVIDLSKIPQLRQAYENFGAEALKLSAENPKKFFSNLGRHAKRSENYGGNTRESGYYDMIDLADLAKKSKELLPQTSENLINAIDDAVVYKINGEYRDQGSGISGFYPYDGGEQMLSMYSQIYSAPLAQKCLYHHLIYGVMPPEAEKVLQNAAIQEVQSVSQPSGKKQIFNIADLEDTKIKLDKNYNAYVKLNSAQMDIVSSVHCILAYVDVENDIILYLGSDSNVDADWDKGIFKDNFDGTWMMLEGYPVYVEVTADEEDYILYSVPIKLNGVRCNLEIAYNYDEKNYKILGARRKYDDKKMADKNLIKLKSGDKITTLHYGMTISGNDTDFTEVEVDTFTVGNKQPVFADESVGSGEYLYCFEFVAPNNETATSEFVNFTVKDDGSITTTKLTD